MFFLPVFNLNYILYMLPAIILGMIVQFYVNSSISRWRQVPNRAGLSGIQIAQKIANRIGLYNLQMKGVSGRLSDHYDPAKNILSLSQDVAQGNSITAMAITAHELGHAQQDQEDYFPLRLRSTLVPAVNIGTTAGWIFILLGLLLQVSNLAWLGVLIFSAGAVFAIATLPVELNASKRARKLLRETGLITTQEEQRGVNQVLNAAALTYVAAIATSVMQLLYFASLAGGINRRRR
jgi:uncharacterized protein